MPGIPNERHIGSSSTHEEICKFEDPQNDRFKSLWKQIDLAIESAQHATRSRERLDSAELSVPVQDCT